MPDPAFLGGWVSVHVNFEVNLKLHVAIGNLIQLQLKDSLMGFIRLMSRTHILLSQINCSKIETHFINDGVS